MTNSFAKVARTQFSGGTTLPHRVCRGIAPIFGIHSPGWVQKRRPLKAAWQPKSLALEAELGPKTHPEIVVDAVQEKDVIPNLRTHPDRTSKSFYASSRVYSEPGRARG